MPLSKFGYHPGGMIMPGRNYNAPSAKDYRYGFNGKENDNDVKGEGNQQDYGMRIYDPRLVRFLSVDSLGRKYPELTPYQFASNTPIQAVDLDGLEAAVLTYNYRVTALLVTGSVSVGATVDYCGNVKVFYSWSAGLGFGAFAGGGLSAAIYPTATASQVMGGGLSVGGNVGIPGVTIGLDINASLQQDGDADITKKVNDVKFGVGGGLKPGSLGPGGVEVHFDYSNSTPILSFNIAQVAGDVVDKIKEHIDLTDDQIKNFIRNINSVEEGLKQMHAQATNNTATPEQKATPNQPQAPKKSDTPKKKVEKPNQQKKKEVLPKSTFKRAPLG